jgi:tetratricopeptide (TPR) repeat protein
MIDEHDFGSMDELREFLNQNVVGKEIPHQEVKTPLGKAQDIIYQAFEARGRRQIQLVRKALDICPDCTDAYVLLAERCSDVSKARDYYAEGVAAGERALGDDFFKEESGNFWGILQTRPYMRAKFALAQCLEELGNIGEAVQHYRELLRLNPNDNQGVRHVLIRSFLEMNANDEAAKLLKKYKEDEFLAIWCYTRALLSFRQKGDTATARNHLKKALDVNGHVPKYLLGYEEMPDLLPSGYSPGSEDEAIICSEQLVDAWEDTEGAMEWLDERVDKL